MMLWHWALLIGLLSCAVLVIAYAALIAAERAERRDNDWRERKHGKDL